MRAFDFTRGNASAYPKGIGQLDQAAFNSAIKLHAEYAFGSAWGVGATYVYANPLGANGTNTKVEDTTLPAFKLSTLGEAYVRYQDSLLNAKIGDQLFTSPWANPSDSRVKPVFFRGVDANVAIAPGWSVGASRMIAWESRVSSDFDRSTLLPGSLAANGALANPTTGFLLGKAGYSHGGTLSANLDYYEFYDYASLLWLDGKWSPLPRSPLKPYVAVQYGTEQNEGKSIAGIVQSRTAGVQIGASVGRNLDLSLGYDSTPWRSEDIAAASCAAAQTASKLFLPAGGTPVCTALGGGTYRVFYGGMASPYTDSYATDPLFTASITQSMVDRRSGGDALKLAATFTTNNRRFKAILSQGWYDYSNGAGANANTTETNVDLTYSFNRVNKGLYRGFQVRNRWAQRDIRNTVTYGGLPVFTYNRTQLEYDF